MARDAYLRWVAERRNLVVASMLADRNVTSPHLPLQAGEDFEDMVIRPDLDPLLAANELLAVSSATGRTES